MDNETLVISGNVSQQSVNQINVPKCADMKTYMRNYMKINYKKYREADLEKAKAQDRRKYWRKKLKSINVVMSNEDFDKYTHDDFNLIYDYIRVQKGMEQKPELLKYIPTI